MERTMLEIAYAELTPVKSLPFKEIWAKVYEELQGSWKIILKGRTKVEIRNRKMGELYKLLTVDGKFIRTQEQEWSLVEKYTYDEVQKMKIYVKETLE